MVKRFTMLITALMISGLLISAYAVGAETGTVNGQLVNGTAGGKSVADVELELKTLVNGQEVASATAKTGSDGTFAFSNLSTDAKNTYQMTLTYEEAEYVSDYLAFDEGETAMTIELTVYDSTNSLEAIRVAQAHTIISVGQGMLEVTEYFLFTNESDRAYIGSGEITSTGKRRTLDFPIKGKISDLQYGDGFMNCCVLPSQSGFADTMPILPGEREVIYAYRVPYSGQTFDFVKTVNYPLDQFNLLVQGNGITISGDKLTSQGPLSMGGATYAYSVAEGLFPGTALTATLSGLPGSTSQKAVIIWVAGALILLTAGSAVVYRRSRTKPQSQPVRIDNDSEQRQEKLLLELAQLDDDFAAGRTPEAAYQKQRAMKKAQLVKLIASSRGGSARR
ncbi:MAG: hypothetical protein HYX84_08720 [Chloroflexi bacterium]|nr:hypothetical protein [Chloroflexota bacterium]